MEVSKADFARMAGVTKAAISKKAKNKRLIINSAGFIDTDNPVNRMYLEFHQQKNNNNLLPASSLPVVAQVAPAFSAPNHAQAAPAFSAPKPAQAAPTGYTPQPHPTAAPAFSAPKPAQTAPAGYASDANQMLNMTLRELLQTYNGIEGVEKYAKILKDLLAADERAQRIQERRQLQIPKDFVISRLFGYLNQQNNRLLDLPESMADQLIALAQTGASEQASAPATAPQNTQTAANPATAPDTLPQAELAQLAAAALAGETKLIEPGATNTTAQNQPEENAVSLNDTRQKIVNYLRDNITRCIGGAKQTIIDELRTLQAKYATEDDTKTQIQDIYEAINENQI